MLAKVISGTTIGLEGVIIEVEVDVASRGFPSFTIVGLPSKGIDEAKDRVRTAVVNTSFEMPDSRLTVNLAPADIPKEGSQFDLPIAVGVLAALGMVKKDLLPTSMFLGELSLEGKLRKISGTISIATTALKKGYTHLFLPEENAAEAAVVQGLEVIPIQTLADCVLHINGDRLIQPTPAISLSLLAKQTPYEFDFEDIRGQEQAKRALEIAASGMHNLFLKGVPGAGKTMLSRAFPSILPPMDDAEILEVTAIHSVAGLTSSCITTRPYRSPHHTISRIGLIGGGAHPAPGEISLAHRGVLFLDEFSEFPRSVLESLRQPLEDGKVSISRASGTLTFPSRFLLLSAANPCPCGYLGHPRKTCRCLPGSVLKYRKRLSGPLLDRIDLHIEVPPVEESKLTSSTLGESSSSIRERVVHARSLQQKRFKTHRIKSNAEMSPSHIKELCKLTIPASTLLKQAISRLALSARSYFKLIKISQTIADLANSTVIHDSHVAEALQYRGKDGEESQ